MPLSQPSDATRLLSYNLFITLGSHLTFSGIMLVIRISTVFHLSQLSSLRKFNRTNRAVVKSMRSDEQFLYAKLGYHYAQGSVARYCYAPLWQNSLGCLNGLGQNAKPGGGAGCLQCGSATEDPSSFCKQYMRILVCAVCLKRWIFPTFTSPRTSLPWRVRPIWNSLAYKLIHFTITLGEDCGLCRLRKKKVCSSFSVLLKLGYI